MGNIIRGGAIRGGHSSKLGKMPFKTSGIRIKLVSINIKLWALLNLWIKKYFITCPG